MKNKILKISVVIDIIVLFLAMASVDSANYYAPCIIVLIATGYLYIFYRINREELEKDV